MSASVRKGRERRNAPVFVQWLLVVGLFALTVAPAARAEDPVPAQDLLIATHVRLGFDKDVERTAVAEEEIVTFNLLNAREGLVLGALAGSHHRHGLVQRRYDAVVLVPRAP